MQESGSGKPNNNSRLIINKSDTNPIVGLDLFGDSIISSIQQRSIDSSVSLQQDGISADNVDFLHAVMCQVSMPKRQTELRRFERRNGRASIVIEAGELWNHDRWIEKPLPAGAKPRLILIHISSEAVRTGKKIIEVGNSAREFLKTLGLDVSGHEYKRFKHQMEALAACHMQIGISKGNKSITLKTQPIEKFEAWCSSDSEQHTFWPGTIELSEKFFTTMQANAVPLDKRALGAIQHSALCLDIYTWLAHRLCRIPEHKNLLLNWDQLKHQFGYEYKHPWHFKNKFTTALKQVLSVYPNAKIESASAGILFKNSPPPIPKTKFLVNINKLT